MEHLLGNLRGKKLFRMKSAWEEAPQLKSPWTLWQSQRIYWKLHYQSECAEISEPMFSGSYLSQGLILYKGTASEEPTKPDQKIIVQTTLSIFCLHPNAMQKCKKKTNKVKIEQILVCTGSANIRQKIPILCGSFGLAFLFCQLDFGQQRRFVF